MLEVSRLTIRYGTFLALDDVEINVQQHEIVGVIGANGAGKSSLIRAIAGLVQPQTGEIRFNGRLLNVEAVHARTRLGISLVPEGRGLFPQMSVEENLMMGGYPLSGRARMKQGMAKCYELFPILADRRRQLAGTLSGGQQQMLAISVGLMSDPKLLILDEPSLGLAPIVIGELGRCLKAFKLSGISILIAEQNASLTGSVADRIYVLQTGRVRYHEKPDVLFTMPAVVESFLTI